MERHGKGARKLEASFFRMMAWFGSLRLKAGQAVTDADIAERLFSERLDALADPLDRFWFPSIRLSASSHSVDCGVTIRLDATAHKAGDVARLIDRLAARLGPRRIIATCRRIRMFRKYVALEVPAQRSRRRRCRGPIVRTGAAQSSRYGCSQCPRRSRLASR